MDILQKKITFAPTRIALEKHPPKKNSSFKHFSFLHGFSKAYTTTFFRWMFLLIQLHFSHVCKHPPRKKTPRILMGFFPMDLVTWVGSHVGSPNISPFWGVWRVC